MPGQKVQEDVNGWGEEEEEEEAGEEEAAAGGVMTEERDKVQECMEKQQGPCSCWKSRPSLCPDGGGTSSTLCTGKSLAWVLAETMLLLLLLLAVLTWQFFIFEK